MEQTKINVLENNPEMDLTTLENNIISMENNTINMENNYDTLNSNSYKLSNTDVDIMTLVNIKKL